MDRSFVEQNFDAEESVILRFGLGEILDQVLPDLVESHDYEIPGYLPSLAKARKNLYPSST